MFHLVFAALLAVAIEDPRPQATIPKLAVLDVGTASAVPPEFLDLVQASLLQSSAVTLVERLELSKILRERALVLSLSSTSDSVAAAGALVAADAFLLLEASAPKDEGIPVRVRLVDAHDGVKLADSIVSLAGSRKDWEESATF
ncbi:MAG: hypothetical protein HYR85_22475, partial [Planctomycetes bacterium]|nr:hypothetical protein [Planctomycetota bacterium]